MTSTSCSRRPARPGAVTTAVDLCRPGGTVVLLGIPDEDSTTFRASTARRKGLTLMLVRRSVPAHERAFRLIEAGRIRLDGLVSHRFPLDRSTRRSSWRSTAPGSRSSSSRAGRVGTQGAATASLPRCPASSSRRCSCSSRYWPVRRPRGADGPRRIRARIDRACHAGAATVPDGFRGGTITRARLPAEAQTTLRLIETGGPFPYDQDGSVFRTGKGLLPARPRGYYHEYTVETPGSADRGARRLVVGAAGERYYTDDHYDSFRFVVDQ